MYNIFPVDETCNMYIIQYFIYNNKILFIRFVRNIKENFESHETISFFSKVI